MKGLIYYWTKFPVSPTSMISVLACFFHFWLGGTMMLMETKGLGGLEGDSQGRLSQAIHISMTGSSTTSSGNNKTCITQ